MTTLSLSPFENAKNLANAILGAAHHKRNTSGQSSPTSSVHSTLSKTSFSLNSLNIPTGNTRHSTDSVLKVKTSAASIYRRFMEKMAALKAVNDGESEAAFRERLRVSDIGASALLQLFVFDRITGAKERDQVVRIVDLVMEQDSTVDLASMVKWKGALQLLFTVLYGENADLGDALLKRNAFKSINVCKYYVEALNRGKKSEEAELAAVKAIKSSYKFINIYKLVGQRLRSRAKGGLKGSKTSREVTALPGRRRVLSAGANSTHPDGSQTVMVNMAALPQRHRTTSNLSNTSSSPPGQVPRRLRSTLSQDSRFSRATIDKHGNGKAPTSAPLKSALVRTPVLERTFVL